MKKHPSLPAIERAPEGTVRDAPALGAGRDRERLGHGHADDGQAGAGGQTFGEGEACPQPGEAAGADRDRDRGKIRDAAAGRRQQLRHQARQQGGVPGLTGALDAGEHGAAARSIGIPRP
jgi:hypothetical protein